MDDIRKKLDIMKRREELLDSYVNMNYSIFKDRTVLDIGPAYGTWSIRALDSGASSVKALEIDDGMIDFFKQIMNYYNKDIPIEKADIVTYKIDKKYDIVLFMAVWHHIPQYDIALDKVFNLSKEYVVLEGPISEVRKIDKHQVWGKCEHHAWYWEPTYDELINEIEKRNGKIVKTSKNSNSSRIYLEVKVG